MLMLLFYIGSDPYAIDYKYIIEVVPCAVLKKIPQLPDYVAGLLNFRGTPIPVIDICQLVVGRPSASRLHTRIILLNNVNSQGEPLRMGIMAEKITESMDQEKENFIEAGWEVKRLPFLGGVLHQNQESIQFFHADRLFDFMKEVLFKNDNTAR